MRCHRLSCEDADAATASAPALIVHCRVQADLSSPDDILPVPSSPPICRFVVLFLILFLWLMIHVC
nr:hypothetical protein Iba_chr12cCG19920 [Ipomoea batatas]